MNNKCPISLVDVYRTKDSVSVLYQLLKERDRSINISHRSLPTLAKHRAFLRSKPYRGWFLIRAEDQLGRPFVGSIYLSKANEIGVFIFKNVQKMGYGRPSVRLLMDKFKGEKRFLANINPVNRRSIQFFASFGFKHIQNTYELRRGENA